MMMAVARLIVIKSYQRRDKLIKFLFFFAAVPPTGPPAGKRINSVNYLTSFMLIVHMPD